MRIAVTGQGRDVSAPVNPRFGRARFLVIMDAETDESCVTDSTQDLNAAQGAGIQAGRNVVKFGAKSVITGYVRPKAFAALQAGGVTVYTGATGTVAGTIEKLKAGKLKQSAGANVEGHWG